MINNALIVEDDTISLNILKSKLRTHFININISGVARNINDAIHLYQQTKPQILFLDINLGNENSFSLLDNIIGDEFDSQVIFITSSRELSIKAINHYVTTGYILKPVSSKDLIKAVNKAIYNIKVALKFGTLEHEQQTCQNKKCVKFIAIPSMNKIEIIKVDEILFCEADGRYTKFHLVNGDIKITSRNLGEYERLLDKSQFFRIHHSYIVNILMINHINKLEGNYCHLMNHKTLPIAKRRQEKLHRFLNLK